MRPEGAELRAKMLHASSLRPFVRRLEGDYGLAFARVAEGLEREEVHQRELYAQLYVYE